MMSAASKRCQFDACERAASTKCFCCRKNACTRHFMQHMEAVKAQIDPLVNDINELVENIRALTTDKITESSFAQLQQWRTNMHEQIDEIFIAKSKEMADLIATNREKFVEHQKLQLEKVMKIQDQVKQFVEDEDVTLEHIQSLRYQIETVQKNLADFERDFLLVSTRELVQELITVSSNFNKPIYLSAFVTWQQNEPIAVPAPSTRLRRRVQQKQTGSFVSKPTSVYASNVFGQASEMNTSTFIPTTTCPPAGILHIVQSPSTFTTAQTSSFGSFRIPTVTMTPNTFANTPSSALNTSTLSPALITFTLSTSPTPAANLSDVPIESTSSTTTTSTPFSPTDHK